MVALPSSTSYLIVGAGFAGIAAAKFFTDAGYDYVHIEKEAGVGGTWWKNRYPGLTCDVPSSLYSYSFADEDYSQYSFASWDEIQSYIEKVVEEYLVPGSIRCGVEMLAMEWKPDLHQWEVVTSAGTIMARNVICATGILDDPQYPPIPGLADFAGTLIHTAQWDEQYDMSGKNIAVIGTGASGIQVIPPLAELANKLIVFQRTACWVLPKFNHRKGKIESLCAKNFLFRKLRRLWVYLFRELQVLGLSRFWLIVKFLELVATMNLRYYVRDKTLQQQLTPHYTLGCKRILLSNNYYKTFARDNVTLETSGIDHITESGIVACDGKVYPCDVIVVATGYNVSTPEISGRISVPTATGTLSLQEFWSENGTLAYWGTTIPGFPNFFLLSGPGTGIGHTSMVYMIEKQLDYICKIFRENHYDPQKVYEISYDEFAQYNDWFKKRISNTVLTSGGCTSWYLGPEGKGPGIWPTWTFKFTPAKQ